MRILSECPIWLITAVMPGSSRKRHKREGTFLENVQDLLQILSSEIQEVKQCIKELQVAPTSNSGTFPYNDLTGSWDKLEPITSTQWYWPMLDSTWCSSFDSSHCAEGNNNEQTWNVLAQAFVPTDETVITRDVLLANLPSESNRDDDEDVVKAVFCHRDDDAEESTLQELLETSETGSHTDPDATQKLVLWRPGEKTIFEKPLLRDELLVEAATVIQRWFRGALVSSEPPDDDIEEYSATDSDADHHRDDNSVEAVSIRRAFFVSIASTNPGTIAQDSGEQWTHREILTWLSGTLDCTVDKADPISKVKAIWREWEKANSFFPHDIRTRIARTLDENLHEKGLPSLRELLDMI